jgi:homocysteine S-methyltransferase
MGQRLGQDVSGIFNSCDVFKANDTSGEGFANAISRVSVREPSNYEEVDRLTASWENFTKQRNRCQLDDSYDMKTMWNSYIAEKGFVLLDGGLATELEAAGHVLNDALWSARVLRDAPAAIAKVHRDYLEAGADVVIAATYQATIPGFVAAGMLEDEAVRLMELAVGIVVEEVRKLGMRNRELGKENKQLPLVAASVGPYGAYLADGSEYRGDYGLSLAELRAFHARRWAILAATEADLLACETLPSLDEARALLDLLHTTPQRQAWFTFSGRDDKHISDGTPIAECGSLLDREPQVAAIGINCTRPQFVAGLIDELRRTTDKPIVVYPNSGELWNARAKCWIEGSAESVPAYVAQAFEWRKRGATLIGGCCRTGPQHVRQLGEQLRAG